MTAMVAKNEPEARERYALALVFATVKRYHPGGGAVDRDDLLSAALVGAAVALARVDELQSEQAFRAFVIAHIRGAMVDEVRFWDPMTRGEQKKVRAGEMPRRIVLSTDAPLHEAGIGRPSHREDYVRDFLADDGDAEEEALTRLEAADWRRLVAKLPEREAYAIRARFWRGRNTREIAAELGICHTRAGQLVRQGLARLKQWGTAFGLAPEEE